MIYGYGAKVTFINLRVALLSSSSTFDESYLQDDILGEEPLEVPGFRGLVGTLCPFVSFASLREKLRCGKL